MKRSGREGRWAEVPSLRARFALVQLRQYVSAGGQLPLEFDDLVPESFGELIQAA